MNSKFTVCVDWDDVLCQCNGYLIEEINKEHERYWFFKNTLEECKQALEEALAKDFNNCHFKPNAVTNVIETYGLEKVKLLLAHTVNKRNWDGRYSEGNKEWALSIHIPSSVKNDVYLVLSSHPGITDLLITHIRSGYKKPE